MVYNGFKICYTYLYKDFDYKKNYIISNTDYELDGDYLIAYKACRSDGYSKYNFQFKYELNKEYECHANYNIDEESSFGLWDWNGGYGLSDFCWYKNCEIS